MSALRCTALWAVRHLYEMRRDETSVAMGVLSESSWAPLIRPRHVLAAACVFECVILLSLPRKVPGRLLRVAHVSAHLTLPPKLARLLPRSIALVSRDPVYVTLGSATFGARCGDATLEGSQFSRERRTGDQVIREPGKIIWVTPVSSLLVRSRCLR